MKETEKHGGDGKKSKHKKSKKSKSKHLPNAITVALEKVGEMAASEFGAKATAFYVVLTCMEQFSTKFAVQGGGKRMKKVFPNYDDGNKLSSALNYIMEEFRTELQPLTQPTFIVQANMLDVAHLDANLLRVVMQPVIDAATEYEKAATEAMRAEVQWALRSGKHSGTKVTVPARTVPQPFTLASGCVSLLGPRKSNEDAEVCSDAFTLSSTTFSDTVALYGIFDGHGGSDMSNLCKEVVPPYVFAQRTFPTDPVDAFTRGFAQADERLREIKQKSGSTCVLATVLSNVLLVGNIGDSEGVLAYEADGEMRYTLLTRKHTVADPAERQRIEAIDHVVVCGRIMGSLAVARAFGDFDFKTKDKPFVSVVPHVTARALHPTDKFLVLGCDGLWDTVSYRDAVVVADKMRRDGSSAEAIAQALADLALARGSTDNVSVIVVFLEWGTQDGDSSGDSADGKTQDSK